MASIMVEFFGFFAVALAGVGYVIIRTGSARGNSAAKRELTAAMVCLVVAALLVIGYRIARWNFRM